MSCCKRMLEGAVRFSFLAFGILGFAPDEHLSGTQPHDWSHMSNISESNVKDPPSARFRTTIHLCEPVSQPDATGFSGAEPAAVAANPPNFANDFVGEHSSAGEAGVPVSSLKIVFRAKAPSESKGVQA